MKYRIGVLADYANQSEGSKLNIMGIFGNITANKVPALHPRMQL